MKLLSALVVFLLFAQATDSPAATYNVPGDFPTIQQAIDAAALDGDSVLVSPGHYPEDIVVSAKTVHIRALDGPASTSLLSARWAFGVNDPTDMTGGTFAGFHVIGDFSGSVTRNLASRDCAVDGLTNTRGAIWHDGVVSLSRCSFSDDVTLEDALANPDRHTVVDFCTFLSGANLECSTSNLIVDSCVFEGGGIRGGVEWSEARILRNSLLGGSGIDVQSGGATIFITDNTVIDSADGIVVGALTDEVARNLIAGSAYGIRCREITGADIEENVVRDCGIGIGGTLYSPVLQNTIHRCGTGIDVDHDLVAPIAGNTVVGCSGPGIRVLGGFSFDGVIERNIATENATGFELSGDADPGLIRCNDAWGNTVANWSGTSDQTGLNGNISADPLFCDEVDFMLRSDSPCLPGNHPDGWDCGQIGARGQGCDPTAVDAVSWGRLKAGYGSK